MTILDYANSRNITVPAVHQALKRYPDDLEGHISKQGKAKILDEFAVLFLDAHIRLPVQVIDDKLTLSFREREVELKQELIKANEARFEEIAITRQDMNARADNIEQKIDKLPELMSAQYDDTNVIKAIEHLEALISELKSESEKKDQRIAALESEKEQLNDTIDNLRAELKSMTDKCMEESSKSVMQKIFGKKEK